MAGENSTIARPYAEAIFQRAIETESLDLWSDMLGLFEQIVGDDRISAIIGNPRVPRPKVEELLLDIGSDRLNDEGRNLVRLLVQNGRLPVLTEIAGMYEALKNEHQGTLDVKIISAFEVDAEQEHKLAKVLKKRLGREVRISSELDPSLIGGMRIRAGDLVIDGSVQSQLQKLAYELDI